MQRLFAYLMLSTLLLGCGSSPPPATASTREVVDEEEDEDSWVDEEPEEEDAEDGAGFIDATLLRTAAAPFDLGEAQVVPGTGVTMRPPAGSQRMPFGAGFLAMRQRIQFSVVVAVGGEEVLDAMRSGGAPNPPEPTTVREVTVSGQNGRQGRDVVTSPAGGSLERSWLLVHDGERALGVIATYESERAEQVRAGITEVLESVRWDREAELDAAAALGLRIDAVDGLERARRSSANLVLMAPGSDYPPTAGQPVVTVSPLPMQIPPDRQEEVCGQLIARFVPAPVADVQLDGAVEGGQLPGCERLATADTREGPRVITYAALLFHGPLPILVTASADADAIETWRPRFASAARAVAAAQ